MTMMMMMAVAMVMMMMMMMPLMTVRRWFRSVVRRPFFFKFGSSFRFCFFSLIRRSGREGSWGAIGRCVSPPNGTSASPFCHRMALAPTDDDHPPNRLTCWFFLFFSFSGFRRGVVLCGCLFSIELEFWVVLVGCTGFGTSFTGFRWGFT